MGTTIFPVAVGIKPPTTLPEIPDHKINNADIEGIANAFVATTTSSSLQTALSVSGQSGVLEMAAIWSGVATVTGTLKVTRDGIVIYNKSASLAQFFIRVACGLIGSDAATPATMVSASLAIMTYEKSILVEFSSSGGNLIECYFRDYIT